MARLAGQFSPSAEVYSAQEYEALQLEMQYLTAPIDFKLEKPPIDDMVLIWHRTCWVGARRKLGYWETAAGAFYGSVKWWARMPPPPDGEESIMTESSQSDASENG